MNIEETIRKQAEAVKANSNNAKAAELLIQAANLLKGTAPAPSAFSIAGNTEKRYSALERFSAAREKNKQAEKERVLSEAHQTLLSDGWKAQARNPATGTAAYNHPSLPGHALNIDGEHFHVSKGGEIIVPKNHLKNLKGALKKIKPL